MEKESKQAIINKKFPIIVAFIVCVLGSFIGGFLVVVATNVVYKNESIVAEQTPSPEVKELPVPESIPDPEITPESTEQTVQTEKQASTALVDKLSLEDIVGWGMAIITGVEITIYGFVKFRWKFNHDQSNIVFFILAGLWVLMNVYVLVIIRSIGGIHAR